MQRAKDGQAIGILTYCRDCQGVFTGRSGACLKCGRGDGLIWFVAGATIKGWVETEQEFEDYKHSNSLCDGPSDPGCPDW